MCTRVLVLAMVVATCTPLMAQRLPANPPVGSVRLQPDQRQTDAVAAFADRFFPQENGAAGRSSALDSGWNQWSDGKDAPDASSGTATCVLHRSALVLRRTSDGASQRTCAAEWKISNRHRSLGWRWSGRWNAIAVHRDRNRRDSVGHGRGVSAGWSTRFLQHTRQRFL